jgi:hypothetical protein
MAGFNISGFQSNISKHGVLQTNKFMVAFASPPCMQGESIDGKTASETEKLIQVRAESVKIPGIALLQTDVNRYGNGPTQKMPFNARFTENAITFVSDRKGEIYRYFYTWMNKIFDFSGSTFPSNVGASYKTEYKDNYVTDLHVYVFDNNGNQVNDIVMYKAYPESMNDINLSWNDASQLMKITVSISFRDWALVGVSNDTNGKQPTTRTNNFTTFTGDSKPALSSNPAYKKMPM